MHIEEIKKIWEHSKNKLYTLDDIKGMLNENDSLDKISTSTISLILRKKLFMSYK